MSNWIGLWVRFRSSELSILWSLLYEDFKNVFFLNFLRDGTGKEIINRVTTSIASSGMFYTDANGRQTLERRFNIRDSYPYTVTEPIAANYYPVNSHAYIKDAVGNQVTMLVDRPQGGSSLHNGELGKTENSIPHTVIKFSNDSIWLYF